MSRKATEFQKKEMSKMYRGKEIFKPLNTGWIDEHVACVREWVANIFFYRKGGTTIMIDAGYNYDRLEEKMGWLGIDPKSIRDILITHQDTDHVGAVEADSPGLFRQARLYVGEIENRYLTGEVRRKVIYHLYKLPQVTINNEKVLLKDEQVFHINSVHVRHRDEIFLRFMLYDRWHQIFNLSGSTEEDFTFAILHILLNVQCNRFCDTEILHCFRNSHTQLRTQIKEVIDCVA